MSAYVLHQTQKIPVSLQQAWDFFSRPENLQAITPAYMQFNITSTLHGEKAYAGQIITYTIRPILNIPLYWMTEITQVNELQYFVDEQKFGPYALWHHQHHFKAIENGVEMTDIVHYKLPLWVLGKLAHGLLVKKQLEDIFAFRHEKIETLFGSYKN